MADFRLRIGFAKRGAAKWLSHLEVVRAMERCVRRSGLPYAISQGFSPHMKHSFSAALPVGTGSCGEYMDVDLLSLVDSEQALAALKAVQHECLPVLSAEYIHKGEPSLQVAFNYAVYLLALDDPQKTLVPELLDRLKALPEITVKKKDKLKTYDLRDYVVEVQRGAAEGELSLSLLSRPEGSLRPEVVLEALAEPDLDVSIISITRTALEQRDT